MRARDQVWSDENESDEAAPAAEQPQPQPTPPAPPARPEAQPEALQTPITSAGEPAAEENHKLGPLPCVHLLEAFFGALASPAPAATVTQEASPAEQPGPAAESRALPVVPDARRGDIEDAAPGPDAQPGAALVAVGFGSLLFYQQDRAARKADERERQTRLASAGR